AREPLTPPAGSPTITDRFLTAHRGAKAVSRPQVLIVGAGPTGLVLALWLARAGVPFRLIDKNPGPGRASRAMAVQARTLEFYRQLGIAEDAIAAGFRLDHLHLRDRSRELAVVP